MTTMKNIFSILAVAALFLTACAKEDAPTPSEEGKNWLEISEPAADADDVDKKIYELYQEFGVPIFYTDTIGSVDYGMVDEAGKPVLSYQMIYPTNPDMTTSGVTVSMLTPVQHWIPTEKEKMMSILDFIGSDLLPLAKKGELDIPAIYIAQSLAINGALKVYRNSNVVTITMVAYDNANAYTLNTIKADYRVDLMSKCMGASWDERLAPFRKVSEDLLVTLAGNDPWSKNDGNNNSWSQIVFNAIGVNWLTLQKNNWILTNYATQLPVLKSYIPWFTDPVRVDYAQVAMYADHVANWEVLKQQEAMWKQRYIRYDPRAYGLTDWTGGPTNYPFAINTVVARTGLDAILSATQLVDYYAVPSKQGDFAAYFAYLMKNPQATLESASYFGNWPVVLERLAMMREILLDMGIDVEVLSGRKQA